jgi:Ca2+-binding EF-hand superfamily protein
VQEADIDSDGFINIEEFQKSVFSNLSTMVKSKAQEIAKKMREENAPLETFKIFDLNGDGFVTAEEIKAVLNKLGKIVTDEAVAAIVTAADVDGNGRISLKKN